MAKNILLGYSILIALLVMQACDCGGNPKIPNKKSDPSASPKPDQPGPKPDPKPDQPDPKPDQPIVNWDLTGNIYKVSAKIDATDRWLHQLGIDKTKKEAVVMNASNPSIKSPGGGIDGALGSWARANGTTPWQNPAPTLLDGSLAPNQLEAGKFALFQVPFGSIYLAVGPQAREVKTLKKTKELITELFYQILSQANKDHMKCVVLCAISTAIFASDGKEADTGKDFTKDEFISTIYEGMKQGIGKFQQENPGHALKIILNNWHSNVVNQVKRLSK